MNEFMARQIIFMMLLLGTAPSFAKSKNSSAPNSPPNVESEWRKVKELQLHFENLESSAANARLIKGAAFLAATGYLWGVYIAEEKVLTGDFLEVSRGVVGVRCAPLRIHACDGNEFLDEGCAAPRISEVGARSMAQECAAT